tara:strand:+ start:190 stop:1881 length:1692 start_codon:yes stop_codon:yes gene_type:complete
MTSVEEQANKKLFSIGIPGAKQRLSSGSFAAAGTVQQQLGSYPQVEIVGGKKGDWPRKISSAQSRAGVDRLMNNAMSKQGKALNKYLSSQSNQSTFGKLRSLPHRIALTTVESNNAIDKTAALQQYLELVVPYVNEHAGGIIGDAIKEEYFQAGRAKWAPLHPNTVRDKKNAGKPGNRRRGHYPRPSIPLFGVTHTPGLPDSWQMYTYRIGNWPHGMNIQGPVKSAIRTRGKYQGKVSHQILRGPGLRNAEFLKESLKTHSVYMAGNLGGPGKLRGQSGFFTEPYKMSTGKTAYPPEMRGAALMDIVARLAPTAQVVRPYAGRGYKAALKASATAKEPSGQAQMKLDNILHPFLIAPYAFYHEEGRGNNPKRPFMSPGLALGMGRVEQLFEVYLKEGAKNFKRAYQETEIEGLKDMNELEALYQAGSDAAGDAVKLSKFTGSAGLTKEPRYANFDHMLDNPMIKHKNMKSLLRRLFGNHLIWWFVPPSKYWHYVGMASDIYGLLYGKKNLGTAIAYVKAMTLGLAGARAGSPVPFTRKARRRKFRQNLYTRAGYHRTQVGGSR